MAKKYKGVSGSNIANATLTAAFQTVRAKKAYLEQADFEQAVERILFSKQANRRLEETGEETEIQTGKVTEEYEKKQLEKTEGIRL